MQCRSPSSASVQVEKYRCIVYFLVHAQFFGNHKLTDKKVTFSVGQKTAKMNTTGWLFVDGNVNIFTFRLYAMITYCVKICMLESSK